MNDNRAIALGATALITVCSGLLMSVVKLSVPSLPDEWPPVHNNDVAMQVEEDNFFEVVEQMQPSRVKDKASPAYTETPQNHKSTPQPTTGPDLQNRGTAGDAPAPVTSQRPSPVQQQTRPQPAQQGPSQDQADREAETRRQVTSQTSDAFQRSQGRNNTSNNGRGEGDSGRPDGTASTTHGTGTGRVNGGWHLPTYARVPSRLTGTIVVTAYIDRQGNVTQCTVTKATPPAGSDPALRQAVINEIRQRKFSRSDSNAPDQSVAVITYTFK